MKVKWTGRSLLTALLAGIIALGSMTTVASAKNNKKTTYRVTVPGGTQLDFRSRPMWITVPGTQVYVVRDDMRPNRDFFRYKNRYYVYSNGTWYRSNQWDGRYVAVKERNLPAQFRQVPQEHWRAYPVGWQNRGRM